MLNIGITLGDPAGIGPEIVAKSLLDMKDRKFKVTLFGDKNNFDLMASKYNMNFSNVDNMEFIDVGNGEFIEFGKVGKEAGKISIKSIEMAVEYAMNNKIDAMATAPINKGAIIKAGSKYIDHTAMLKGLTKSKFITTLFEVNNLRITFLSKHISLSDAIKYIKRDNIYSGIQETYQSMKLLGFDNPKIGVAALNPHGGESGMFGYEEINEIKPAIDMAKDIINVYGPVPADSVFHYASLGYYDVVLSLYHDQGHIAAKTYDFDHTVSMNPGLPFLRTSVDHGTAFDIAGKNMGNFISMTESIIKAEKYAVKYKTNYEKYKNKF